MSLRQMSARIRACFRASRLDRDLADELASHIAMRTEEHLRRGMPPHDAERLARVEFGGIAQLAEAHRDMRGLPFLDTFLQDLRYAFRTFRRDAGFTTFAILIVGLGIAASSTVFGVVNAVHLRPLPFRDPGRLVWIGNDGKEGDLSNLTVPVTPFLELRDQARSLSDAAAYYAFYEPGDSKLTGVGEPERLTGVPVSQGLFPLLGVEPQVGRLFTGEECRQNLPVVLLSAGIWKRRFGGDPAIIGSKLTLNGRPFTVIGVMPQSLDFGSIFAPGSRIDLFLPLPLTPDVNRQGNTLSLIGRLSPGVSVPQAQAELNILSEPIRVANNRDQLRFVASLLGEHVAGRLRPALFVLACAVGVVMLIVCANLSNLQLARTAARQKEMAIRVALGAGRSRLIRQMLTESMVLSCGAAAVGLALALVGTRLLAHLDALSLPLLENVGVDARVFAFTLLLTLATGLVFGLVPAFQVPARSVHEPLKDATRGSTEGRRHHVLRSALVVSEVAFACVLLVGAGLLIRSFLRVLNVNLGFRPERAAAMRIDPGSQYSTQAKRNTYFDEVLRLVKSVPGVEGAGLTDVLPLGHNRSWSAGAKGQAYSIAHPPPDVFVRIVSDGYLNAMGIRLLAGRDLTQRDTASSVPVMLINQTLARTLWPGRSAIGQMARYVDVDRQVVGVVADVRHLSVEQGSGCEMYLPIRQTNDYASVDLVVRTSVAPAEFAPAIRAALKPVEPNLPAHEFRTLQELVDKAVSPRRFVALLLAGFSGFALILAALGIYGVVSYSVTQRTQEIGIRMALGASAGVLRSRIMLQTLGLAGAGILTGAAGSWILTRALNGLLFGVTATDPVTFLGMIVVLIAAALAAGYFPARRASRIDPVAALRAG
ncbi:MAG: ABC transporter permease [Candidatus Sulfopaludibacter sp.]|nr:ABC transporter permease [Candidatus Sulfopaludibacter sp.]